MSVIELPPSPNWYQSAICSTSSACGGLMACGAKDSVLVLAFADGAFVGSEHELSERLSFASCVCVCVCVWTFHRRCYASRRYSAVRPDRR